MENAGKSLPVQTFKRLPDYYNMLVKLDMNGVENVSSTMIAEALGLNDIVVRKDLAAVSAGGGRPRVGFSVVGLKQCMGECLGYYNVDRAVLAGAGQLGRALLSYAGFEEYGVRILAGFDADESVVGLEKGGKPIMHISELQGFCRRFGVRIGIIAVPAAAAQSVCDMLAAGGVLAVWNFAPIPLKAAKDVYVYNENMARPLSLLSRHLAEVGRGGA